MSGIIVTVASCIIFSLFYNKNLGTRRSTQDYRQPFNVALIPISIFIPAVFQLINHKRFEFQDSSNLSFLVIATFFADGISRLLTGNRCEKSIIKKMVLFISYGVLFLSCAEIIFHVTKLVIILSTYVYGGPELISITCAAALASFYIIFPIRRLQHGLFVASGLVFSLGCALTLLINKMEINTNFFKFEILHYYYLEIPILLHSLSIGGLFATALLSLWYFRGRVDGPAHWTGRDVRVMAGAISSFAVTLSAYFKWKGSSYSNVYAIPILEPFFVSAIFLFLVGALSSFIDCAVEATQDAFGLDLDIPGSALRGGIFAAALLLGTIPIFSAGN
ncbi:hypothetical protein [Asticcacaulis sp. W401b]|uniref:hypothetical protein n=1 Tax=Asticcacaulis sp. W401b TaxID=3388666 RepID=UPI003970D95D